jgi:hypothetical protein
VSKIVTIMINLTKLDEVCRPMAEQLQGNHMARLGIRRTMRVAHFYNRIKYRREDNWRSRLYRRQLDELLAENGPLSRPKIKIRDGWAIDDSMSLPHLQQILEDSEEIFAEREGARTSEKGGYRSHFQDLWRPLDDSKKYPAFLDFATCSDVLASVIDYIGTIPVLTNNVPSGIRVVESNAAFDDKPGQLHDSQLYHIDYYSLPNVYVLVLLRDTTSENGPWTFLPRSVTERVSSKLHYWTKEHGYRLTDDQVYSVAKRDEVIEFTGKRGTVLFIESSGCMHFGSRNCVKPRFQLMLGYSGICRTDFHETFAHWQNYAVRPEDSRLRKMVLMKNLRPKTNRAFPEV